MENEKIDNIETELEDVTDLLFNTTNLLKDC
jgi:hypothetical protein